MESSSRTVDSLLTLMNGRVKLEEHCLRILAKGIETASEMTSTARFQASEVGIAGSDESLVGLLRLLSARSIRGIHETGAPWVAPLCWGSAHNGEVTMRFAPEAWPSLRALRSNTPHAEELIFFLRAPRKYVIGLYLILRNWPTEMHGAPWHFTLIEMRARLAEVLGLPSIDQLTAPADFFKFAIEESTEIINENTDLKLRVEATREVENGPITGARFYLVTISSPRDIFPLIQLPPEVGTSRRRAAANAGLPAAMVPAAPQPRRARKRTRRRKPASTLAAAA